MSVIPYSSTRVVSKEIGSRMTMACQATADLDKQMRFLRDTMKGIQIRTAGFKKHHDEAARATARATVELLEAMGSMNKGK